MNTGYPAGKHFPYTTLRIFHCNVAIASGPFRITNVRIKIANVRFIRVCFYTMVFPVLRRRNSTYCKPPIKSLFLTLFPAAYPYSELVFFPWFGSSLFRVSEMSGYTHFLHFSRIQTVFAPLRSFPCWH